MKSKNEMQEELHSLRKRIDDLEKELKNSPADSEPSIYDLMPIGSIWGGWEVKEHDKESAERPVRLSHVWIYSHIWPTRENLYKLIHEQKLLNCSKKVAEIATKYIREKYVDHIDDLIDAVTEYEKLKESES